ncbi:MAG: hypothetical protein GTN49_13210 [candidate division Zixibacteria bacterium]|nr:hypothetical protein [candidate division Zixibacteria bacterium]
MSRVKVVSVYGLAALNLLVVGSPGGSVAEEPAPFSYVFAGEWGKPGTRDGEFRCLEAITIGPDGNVYVVDSGNSRIQYFTRDGSFLGKWGSRGNGPGQFNNPRAMAAAPNGDIYVTDWVDIERTRIQRFTSNGSYVLEWRFGGDEPEIRYSWGDYYEDYYDVPTDLAIGPNGHVYVLGDVSRQVHEYTPTGSLICEWGDTRLWGPEEAVWYEETPGPPGMFWSPDGIALAPNGGVYVADTGFYRVQYFSPTGSFRGMWGEYGGGPGQFDHPDGIDVGEDGIVFVTDRHNHRVQYFTATGSLLGLWGSRGAGPGEFEYPAYVAVNTGEVVYVTDDTNDRVQYFRRTSGEPK